MKKTVLLVFCLIASSIIGLGQTYWHASHPGSDGYNLLGYIVIDNEEIHSESLEIGTFLGDQCVGADWAPYEYGGHMFTFVTFYGTVGDVVTFKLYDHELGRVLELNCEVSATLASNGGCIGCNMIEEEYFVFRFTTPSTTQTYELEIPGYGAGNTGGYHLIASPVTEEITPSAENGFVSGNFDLYYFDQTSEDEWINYKLENNGGYADWTINSGKGYLYASESGTTLQFTGTPYSGEGNIPLVYSTTNPSANMRGWNLIGNPYPQEASIDMACYKMNTAGTELEACDAGAVVPAMNGVFVKATAEGHSANFSTISNSNHDGHIIASVLKDRGNTIDRAIVRLGEGSTLPKFMLNPNNTKIYIEQDGDDYAVVSSTANELPISFKAASNGTYTLNVAVENTEMHYLHLIDNIAGTDTDLLANPSYTFEASTGDHANRFTLVMSSTVGVEEHFAFYNGHNWTVSNPSTGSGPATLQVIDMTGRVVSTKTIDGTTQLDVNAAPGVYMFRLVNGNDVKVQKVVVR